MWRLVEEAVEVRTGPKTRCVPFVAPRRFTVVLIGLKEDADRHRGSQAVRVQKSQDRELGPGPQGSSAAVMDYRKVESAESTLRFFWSRKELTRFFH